jgi:hypothetical protein
MSLPFGLPSWGVLAFLAGAASTVAAYFGGRGTATAQLQTALNDAFRSLTTELQGERASLIARVSELERELARAKAESVERMGLIRGHEQRELSLVNLLLRSGVDLPGGEVIDLKAGKDHG